MTKNRKAKRKALRTIKTAAEIAALSRPPPRKQKRAGGKVNVMNAPQGSLGRILGGALGGGAATLLGFPEFAGISSSVGQELGGEAAKHLSNLMRGIFSGSGDYHLDEESLPRINSFVPGRHRVDALSAGDVGEALAHASFQAEAGPGGETWIRVSGRAFLDELRSSQSFIVKSYDIDVAKNGMGEWLGSLGVHYSKVFIDGLVYQVISLANPVTGSLAAGQIGLAVQYDPDGAAPGDMRTLLNYQSPQTGKPTDSLACFVECAANTQGINPLYVGGNSVHEDPKRTTSMGRFHVATDGMPEDGKLIGNIMVTFDLRFMLQRMPEDPANTRSSVALWQFQPVLNAQPWFPFGDSTTAKLPDPVFEAGPAVTIARADNNDPGSPLILFPLSNAEDRANYYVVLYMVGKGGTNMSNPAITFIPDTPAPVGFGAVELVEDVLLDGYAAAGTYGTVNIAANTAVTFLRACLVRAPRGADGAKFGRLIVAGSDSSRTDGATGSLLVMQLTPGLLGAAKGGPSNEDLQCEIGDLRRLIQSLVKPGAMGLQSGSPNAPPTQVKSGGASVPAGPRAAAGSVDVAEAVAAYQRAIENSIKSTGYEFVFPEDGEGLPPATRTREEPRA